MTSNSYSALLRDYLSYLQNERRSSVHTLSNYSRDLYSLFELLGDMPLETVQGHHIRRYIAQLHSKGLGGKSLARRLSAWRGFFAYLGRDHGMQNNPCVGLRAPKSARALPHVLSPDEAGQLLNFAVNGEPLAVRDKAMYELCYSSGLRLAELVGLDVADALQAIADGEVRVVGKGEKTRVVPVGEFAQRAVQAWLSVRDTLLHEPHSALFLGRNGTRLTPRNVQLRLREWGIKQGISSNLHPHLLRHSFASHVLQSSGDLRAVQEMLGHASISTTQIYTHLDSQHLSDTYDKSHPRAKRKPLREE